MMKRKDAIMKVKNIFSSINLILVMGLMLTACAQEEHNSPDNKPYKTENGFYVYPVDFQCAVPGYDNEGQTRAVSSDWNKNTSLFARFQSGSNYYYGFLTYGDNGWDLLSTNDFLEMTTTGTVELYYFQEANGDYYYLNLDTQCLDIYNNGAFVKNTSIAWNSSSIEFSEGTAVYLTRSATYSKTGKAGNSGSFTINATLEPGLWRMRFNGTNGTTIAMPAADNDILYLSSFNWYGSDNVSFSGGAKDISLKVSNNYTPYIYGQFSSTSNKITVKNGNDTFTRNLSSSNLYAGKSGCFTLPTSSNYSSTGWTMTSNTITANPSVVTVHGKERDYQKDDDHPNGTGNVWDNQLFIVANRALSTGEETVVEFDYLSSIDATVSTHCHKNPGGYVHWVCIGSIDFTPKEKHFSKTFKIPAEADGMRTIAFNMAEIKSACDYTIKNVIWKLKDNSETLIDMSGTKNFYYREGASDVIHEY